MHKMIIDIEDKALAYDRRVSVLLMHKEMLGTEWTT